MKQINNKDLMRIANEEAISIINTSLESHIR